MKLAIIGTGNIGKSIGTWASSSGYEVVFASRNSDHAREAAAEAGKNSKSVKINDAVDSADMVLLAVPYNAVKEVLAEVGPKLKNKVLIDVTNPLSSDYSGLTIGFNTSAAEEIQKLAPQAKVVKAFNTIFADVFRSRNPILKGSKIAVFIAGDDKEAKHKVSELVSNLGFDAVDTGTLKSARNIEPLALLNITLGYAQGNGTMIGFSFIR
jgi:NADPH-dependent F420 reductase